MVETGIESSDFEVPIVIIIFIVVMPFVIVVVCGGGGGGGVEVINITWFIF